MLDDLMGMMGKLQEAKKQAEEAKAKLKDIRVEGEAGGGAVRVFATASGEIKDIEMVDGLAEDKEMLSDLLVIAINNALAKGKALEESELKNAMKDSLPDIPGMGL